MSLEDQVRLVSAAWGSPLPRLLVFDNCEDEGLLAQWRPPSGGCRVLVTSRRGQWEATLGVQTLPLGVLKRTESLALLIFRYRLSVDATPIEGGIGAQGPLKLGEVGAAAWAILDVDSAR